MGITAKCVHSVTQDPTDTELPSRFPRPCYNWPLLSAEGEGAVCNELSWTRRSAKFLQSQRRPLLEPSNCRCFQQGEGPSRGLLLALFNFAKVC